MIKHIFLGIFLIVNVGCGPETGKSSSRNRKGSPSSRSNKPGKTPETLDPADQVELTPLRTDGAYNIALSPGGGLNAYASLYLSHKFAAQAGKKIDELFDLFWGLSGGTLPATMLMDKRSDQALSNFKTQVKTAFPDIPDIIKAIGTNLVKFAAIANDSEGLRRKAYDSALVANLKDIKFNNKAGNRFVLVASASNKKSVCYADESIKLPPTCLYRVEAGTRVADGIINSSNFQIPKNELISRLDPAFQSAAAMVPLKFIPLFQKQKVNLLPTEEKLEVVDGFHANAKDLDGTSPLPLAVDYLLQFKTTNNAEHNIVVFDNGSAAIPQYSNQSYRDSIGMDADGYAKYQKNGVTVNVYLLKLNVTKAQFDSWAYDNEDAHWTSTEAMVNGEIAGPRKGIFDRAVDAIQKSLP